ncbi:hypothetical protein SAMN05444166_0344 [Singulisphaera sp. GP187]|uniref:anti-sigma factor family protein n=1 Tax=Singulisphaera sp. GP187 TaxID=1882752 RepID=UPI00092A8E59|nr:hypothetical protein [Singulisphaera sp. GP187]SIN71324.1 hypothetical protein SAMN05444166_0344 [Singulisphaera sp. GP187]
MTGARYHELLGQLLDGSLSEADAGELRRELESDPDRFRDVREHLMLSDLLAQELAPHRAPEAFWQGVQSRLNAPSDEGAAVEASTPPRPFALEPPARRKYGRLAAGIAAGVLLSFALVSQWFASKPHGVNNVPLSSGSLESRLPGATQVSLRGVVVCVHCTLHQTEKCQPAVRIHEEGHEETLFLDDNAVRRDFNRKQGCGRTPLQVLAEGTMHTENGRPLLAATRLEVQR